MQRRTHHTTVRLGDFGINEFTPAIDLSAAIYGSLVFKKAAPDSLNIVGEASPDGAIWYAAGVANFGPGVESATIMASGVPSTKFARYQFVGAAVTDVVFDIHHGMARALWNLGALAAPAAFGGGQAGGNMLGAFK